jgi:ACR3 family arsenite efflux pump ArsB
VINSPTKILIKRFIIYIAILVGKKSRIYLTKKKGKKNSMKESKNKAGLNASAVAHMLHFVIITYYDI